MVSISAELDLFMSILTAATHNQGVCIRALADRHGVSRRAVLDALADLTITGILHCRTTNVSGFLALSLGPKAVQAIFLFALNCDFEGNLSGAVTAQEPDLAITAEGRAC